MRLMRSLAVAVAVVLFAAGGARAQDVILSVAVSLKEVTEDLGRTFMAADPGVTLRYNLGASGDLQKQIEAGAPLDVFLSAAQRQMDELERQNLIVKASRRVFARNALVVVKPPDSRVDISKPADLIGARVVRIAIGNPRRPFARPTTAIAPSCILGRSWRPPTSRHSARPSSISWAAHRAGTR
jgi:molybdenum ABC transporter molybdate-binding protein